MENSEEKEEPKEHVERPSIAIPGFDSLEQFVQAGFKILIEATKASNRLPSGKSRDFYEAYPAFHRVMNNQGESVMSELSRVMKLAGCKGNIQRRDEEERQEMIVDANDTIFERVGTLLDDIAGIRRNPDVELINKDNKQISGSWNKRTLAFSAPQKISPALAITLHSSKNMEKPQLHFAEKVDNSRDTVFVPKIKFKHNILKPLSILFENDENGGQYSHPYEFEIEMLIPAEENLKKSEPVMYPSLPDTPLLHVTEVEQVKEMMAHLRAAKEIAIDLEHHSYRTFQGFTCLMQISTRSMDFIVDTITLREHLQDLNEVFTDPGIVKVLHGAQMDIQWLQRDLGLYIVNMFDTHIAAKVLNYSALSLAYLLNRFCGVQAQKQFQLADWRIRPLPEEMIHYAREDTHYLLYIADMLKNLLIEKANGQDNLLRRVLTESNQLCLKRYVKPLWHSEDYLHIYHKSKRLFNNRQLFALSQLYEWRDRTAREQDESIGFVLPNHMLLHLADVLPREVQGILACCNPIPALVRQNLTALHYLIRKARDQPLVKPIQDTDRQVDRTETFGLNAESALRCPFDNSWIPDFRADLPVLLGDSGPEIIASKSQQLQAEKPKVTVFETHSTLCKKQNSSTLTPYQRYKLVKPYADAVAKDVTMEVEANKEAVEKKKLDEVKEAVKKEPEEGTVPIRKQFEPNEKRNKLDKADVFEPKQNIRKKTQTDIVQQHAKKKLDVEVEVVNQPEKKKPKMSTKGEKLLKNPFHVPADAETLPNKVKNKVKHTAPEKHNFDYSSVDYRKFQSNPSDKVTHKEKKNKTKHKHMGKKKNKVSI